MCIHVALVSITTLATAPGMVSYESWFDRYNDVHECNVEFDTEENAIAFLKDIGYISSEVDAKHFILN